MALELAYDDYGDGPPVVVLHGLLGSARNWASVARRLAERQRVLAVDLRNHGRSPWAEPMTYEAMAADVVRLLDSLRLAEAAVIGHSMGGKAAIVMALAAAARVERLIVVDIAPVAYGRTFLPYVEAMRAIDLAALRRRAEAEAALAKSITDPAVRSFLLQNLEADGGRLRWRPNLDALAGAMPGLMGFPADLPATTYAGPTLFVAGEHSDYVRPEHRPAIQRLLPKARFVTVRGAGHWVHAEQPERFLASIGPFLGSRSA